MKIEIEVKDLSDFAKGVNNALICYADILNCLKLGCSPGIRNSVKEAFEKIPEKELNKRVEELENVYYQLLKLEEGV